MPFSSGTFSVVYNWTTESGAPPIEIAKLDTQHADFATGLSNCLLRDGTGLPTAAIPWNSQNLTGVAELQAARFVPTGSTVPSNGMYLSAANTVAFATNTTLRGSVNSTGNWTIAAPSSGTAVTITAVAGSSRAITVGNGTVDGYWAFTAGNVMQFGTAGSHAISLITANSERIAIGTAGNVTIAAPSSGHTLTLAHSAGTSTAAIVTTDGTVIGRLNSVAATSLNLVVTTAHGLNLGTNDTVRLAIGSAGNITANAPSSGLALTVNAASGQEAVNMVGSSGGGGIRMSENGVRTWAIRPGGTTTNILDISDLTRSATLATVNSTGNWTFNAPTGGATVTVNGTNTNVTLALGSTGAATNFNLGWNVGLLSNAWNIYASSTDPLRIGTAGNAQFGISTNSNTRYQISGAGNHEIFAPSSGTTLVVNGASGLICANFQGAAADSSRVEVTRGGGTAGTDSFAIIQDTSSVARLFNRANAAMDFSTNGTQRVNIAAAGNVTINTPTSGVGLTVSGGGAAITGNSTVTGTLDITSTATMGTSSTVGGNVIGYRDIVRRTSGFARGECTAISAGVTLNTSDMSAGYTFSLYNDSASNITITQGAGVTLRLSGTSTTGNRTLLARGIATIWCNSGTEAVMSGAVT